MLAPSAVNMIQLFNYAISLSAEKDMKQQEYLMAQLQASTLKDMVDALISRRIELVAEQCHDILAFYEKQQQAYLQEKDKYTDKMLDCSDPLKRSELMSRANEVDTRLAELRIDARKLFELMGILLINIGGGSNDKVMGFASDLVGPLGLPKQLTFTS